MNNVVKPEPNLNDTNSIAQSMPKNMPDDFDLSIKPKFPY